MLGHMQTKDWESCEMLPKNFAKHMIVYMIVLHGLRNAS